MPGRLFLICLFWQMPCITAAEAAVRSLAMQNEKETLVPFKGVTLTIYDPVKKDYRSIEPTLVISLYSCVNETTTESQPIKNETKRWWHWKLSSVTAEPGVLFSFWSSTPTPPAKLISIQNNGKKDSYLCWSEYLFGAVKYRKISKSDFPLMPDTAENNDSQAHFIPVVELLGRKPFEGVNAQFFDIIVLSLVDDEQGVLRAKIKGVADDVFSLHLDKVDMRWKKD